MAGYCQPPHKWPKGVSGNPNGSSRKRRLGAKLKRFLRESGREDALIQHMYDCAMSGSYPHLREIFDRVDGKVASGDDNQAQTVNYDDEPEPAPEQLDQAGPEPVS